jgi:hypothetical protein
MLFQQLHIGDRHAAVHGFAHVVNGQKGDLHGGQGFHLDAGGADGFGGGAAQDAVVGFAAAELDVLKSYPQFQIYWDKIGTSFPTFFHLRWNQINVSSFNLHRAADGGGRGPWGGAALFVDGLAHTRGFLNRTQTSQGKCCLPMFDAQPVEHRQHRADFERRAVVTMQSGIDTRPRQHIKGQVYRSPIARKK